MNVTPLEAAQVIERSSHPFELPTDPVTGLFSADATVPPTLFTTKEYAAALKVLDSRERASRLHATKEG